MRVQVSAVIAKQAAICEFMGERMLEGVFKIRDRLHLINDLGPLKLAKLPVKILLLLIGNSLQQRKWNILPDYRSHL